MTDHRQSNLLIITRGLNSHTINTISLTDQKAARKYIEEKIDYLFQGQLTEVQLSREQSHPKQNEEKDIDQCFNSSESYEIDILKQQILLFEKDEEMLNYIQTQKILAHKPQSQLSQLCFCLLKLSKELITNQKPMIILKLKQEPYSKDKLDKIEQECMNTLIRVKQQRKKIQRCCICLTNQSKMIVVPCMHLVLCFQCASPLLIKCPICNQQIHSIQQVFQ